MYNNRDKIGASANGIFNGKLDSLAGVAAVVVPLHSWQTTTKTTAFRYIIRDTAAGRERAADVEVAFGCRLAVASGTITASVASALFINYHDTIPKVSSASSSSWCGPHTETASNGNDSQREDRCRYWMLRWEGGRLLMKMIMLFDRGIATNSWTFVVLPFQIIYYARNLKFLIRIGKFGGVFGNGRMIRINDTFTSSLAAGLPWWGYTTREVVLINM